MEYVIAVVVGLLVFVYGFKRGYEYREKQAVQKLDHLMEMIQLEEEASTIYIKIEKVKDSFYVYNEDDGTFMGQGSTKQEITDVLNARYPNIKFKASEQNLKEVGFPHE